MTFTYVDGEVIEHIASADGKRQLDIVRRPDGICRFTEHILDHDEYSGDYWAAGFHSGLYSDARAAKADAVAQLGWLRLELPPDWPERL